MRLISPQILIPLSRDCKPRLDFLIMYKNGLVKKIRLISKLMTSQLGKQLQYTYCPISQEVKAIRQ